MDISNGLIDKSFRKYTNRKKLCDIGSDNTDKSKKYYYCQSHKDCPICKAFFI